MRAEARSSAGIRKAFFDNARWLVLNLVFLKLKPEQGEDLALSPHEQAAIAAARSRFGSTVERLRDPRLGEQTPRTTSGELFDQPRHFRSVFCDPADCQRLRNATLSLFGQETRRALTVKRTLGDVFKATEDKDETDHRREQLIAAIEGKLRQGITLTSLFQIRWRFL